MRYRHLHLLALAVLCHLCVGASCDGGRKPGAQAEAPSAEGANVEQIESLPGIDTSELTEAETENWVKLVNGQLSPCGEPVSVARCIVEARKCGACVTAARYLTRLVLEGYAPATIEDYYRARFDPDKKAEIALEGAPVRGAPMAPITIVEFSDFQCPFCGAAYPKLEELLRQFEGKAKLVFKHYPLPSHSRAIPAACAAEAAGRQGKFWEMHDLLFKNQRALEEADLIRYADTLGLDMERFKTDLASPEVMAKVAADRKLGESMKIEGTPTLYVNGRHFDEPLKALPAYLEEEQEL